jgi:predicted HTH domain antitoxin
MKSINIKIPEDVVLAAKIPRKRFKENIKEELAVHLYKEGILPLGAARKLSGMEKVAFHFFLGQRKVERHYDIDDYKKDLEQVVKWPQE